MNRTDAGYMKNKLTKSRFFALGTLMVIALLFFYSCLDNGQFITDNEELYKFREKDPRDLKNAGEFFKKGEYLEAIRLYKSVVTYNYTLTSLYYKIGLCYSNLYNPQGDYKGKNRLYHFNAFYFFDKAINKKVKDIDLYFSYGDFLRKINRFNRAESFYSKGLELNPECPDHYLSYAYILFERRKFEEVVLILKKRLYILLNPRIIYIVREIEKRRQQLEEVEHIRKRIIRIKRQKKITGEDRARYLAHAEERLRHLPGFNKGSCQLKILERILSKAIKAAESKVNRLPAKKKQALIEAYYLLGETCWAWKRVPSLSMPEPDWRVILDEGTGYLEKVLSLNPDYADAYLYISKLYLQKITVEPFKYEQYKCLSDRYYKLYRAKESVK
ncbi:MAG: hypothetical protein GY757_17555 [bacterium]|nr:hypothetical protein [bacterium]